MTRTVVMLVLAAVVGLTIGIVGTRVLGAQPAAITRTPLLTAELMGITGKDVTMFTAEIPPGARTGKHYHPGTSSSTCWKTAVYSRSKAKPPSR